MPRVIITVPEKNAQPYRFKLDRKVVSLGRGSDNDIVIDSVSVSGKHAEMHRVEGGYELADIGSTNGIKYDGSRQQKISLRSGMTVKLGDVSFDFTLTEEELESLGHEKPLNESPISKEPEEEAPKKKEKAKREPESSPRRKVVVQQSAGAGFGMIILFLVLAAACFYAGLAIRHEKDTGESLIKAMANKGDVEKEAPAPTPPAPEE